MSPTGLEVFDDKVHKTNSWLKEIAQSLGRDHRAAYHAIRAELLALRDRLTHFGDKLPMLVRGIYFDGLHSAGKPDRVRSRGEFLQRINDRLHIATVGPEDAARAVFKVLVHHLAPGEIRRVVSELSRDIGALCNELHLQCWNPRCCASALARNILPRKKFSRHCAPFSAATSSRSSCPPGATEGVQSSDRRPTVHDRFRTRPETAVLRLYHLRYHG
jgi:uncharacterized protein (DUF2267 family)